MNLQDVAVLITGGASGLGAATAQLLAQQGAKVALVDDLIATGGTALAAAELVRKAGGEVAAALFVVDLPDLGGATRLRDSNIEVHTLLAFEGE